ncbi:MAG: hypothetical protein KF819_20120 [Labilithrix sp.]|nr:hypothetical protein [Labilithrix sp.]
MNRKWFALAFVAPALGAWAVGCGDDEIYDGNDAGTLDGGPLPDVGPLPEPDGGPPRIGCGDAGGAPARLLLSFNTVPTSELSAFNLATKMVDGKNQYTSDFGTTYTFGADPYILAQEADRVIRLDAREPWKAVSSWNVRGDDALDGGMPYANPSAIVVPSCTKGYVLRFNRNKIAVVDTDVVADGGAPASYIDLAPLLQAGDRDGIVEMTSALYVPGKNRIYVLLGNTDFTKIAGDGYTALCADTKPTIAAIDATTGQLVSLGGTGPGGSIELAGYNPPLGTPLWYDAAGDRLLVLSAGCNTDLGDGGAGPIERRRVEEVNLATGAVKTLLPLDTQGFPGGFVFIDQNRAALAFFGQAFLWNPAETTLGPEIPGGLDYLSYDGQGNIVGARVKYVMEDGSFVPGPVEIVSVPYTDAGAVDAASVSVLGADPFTKNRGGFLSGAEVWPRP